MLHVCCVWVKVAAEGALTFIILFPAPPALLNSSQPRFYPSVSNQRRIRTKKLRKSPGQVKLRSSITPGAVLILLTGRHKGKVGGARGHGDGVAQG